MTAMHAARQNQKTVIGQRLRAARNAKGLTQFVLAKRLKISSATLRTVEEGTIEQLHILDNHVKFICQELNLDINEIMA